jgi:hypothetical protein
MTLRTTSKVITFVHPFALPGLDHAQPSGAYTVQTDEEPIESLSFLAYRRVATLIFLSLHPKKSGSFQAISVAPEELEAAQACDVSASPGGRSV